MTGEYTPTVGRIEFAPRTPRSTKVQGARCSRCHEAPDVLHEVGGTGGWLCDDCWRKITGGWEAKGHA